MITIQTQPSLIVPGVQARIRFTPQTGNFLRVWVTDAPSGSTLRKQLDNDVDARIRIADLKEIKGTFEWTFIPDRGGKYLLAVQEYNRGTNFGGSYADDPDAQRKEDAVGAEDTYQTITVAERLVQRIGAGADTAELVVYVTDTLIRETNLETHGEKTPAIIDPRSARAASAVVTPAVKTALAALGEAVAATTLGELSLVLTVMINRFNDHLQQSGVHYTDDNAHRISTSYRNPTSPRDMEKSVQELFKQMKFHFENQDVDQIGVGSADYHQEPGGGETQGDFSNSPITQPPTDTATMIACIADAHRAFEAHRLWNGHDNEDTSNTAGTLPPLLALHSAFLTAIQALNPVTPPVENSAATTLIHGAGFERRER